MRRFTFATFLFYSKMPISVPITQASSQTAHVKRLYFIRHGETSSNAAGILQGSGTNDKLNERVFF